MSVTPLDQLDVSTQTAGTHRAHSRRAVLRLGLAAGLAAPALGALLAACGGEDDEPTAASGAGATATTSGEDGGAPQRSDLLRLLYWQAPTTLNPHLTFNGYDQAAACLTLEPLTTFDSQDQLQPVLAAEIPTIENGGLAADGTSVTYKLRDGVVWSDGTPFTAEDVRFTWEWVTNPETAAYTSALYSPISDVEVVDERTVTLRFSEPNPGWYVPFSTGFGGQVLPKHVMGEWVGEQASDAPFNQQPVGTGPFVVTRFNPGDMVQYERNPRYREEGKPYFERVDLKGGGDATSSARALFQTGETDWAANLQIEPELLEELASGSERGVLVSTPSSSVEQVLVNFANPREEVDGAYSEPSTTHPFLSDPAVRQALLLSCDRETIATQLYGETGTATPNVLTAPERIVSPNTAMVYDPEQAAALLDEAGWEVVDGVREKEGVRLKILLQTITNPVRQKTQELLKQWWEDAGFEVELKAIPFNVYYDSNPGNTDSASHFYADLEMHTVWPPNPYPLDYLRFWYSGDPAEDVAQQSNGWSGRNITRWMNDEYNALFEQAMTEVDPDEQARLYIAMNDRVVNEVVVIPLVRRNWIAGASSRLQGYATSQWTPDTAGIADWYFAEGE
jgi:peptide/nickel transport system substrate-binding protein